VPDVQPSREEELRRLFRWLAFSERLDRLIEVAEIRPATTAPAPAAASALAAAPRRRPVGLRAGLAIRLARVARAVDPEAAAGAVRSPLEGQA